MSEPLRPGQTIGILGGGQLGRMMTMAARRMGLRVKVAAEPGTCAEQSLADETCSLALDDAEGLTRFIQGCDRLTFESENWSADLLRQATERVALYPCVDLQRVAQHRLEEKRFIQSVGAPVVPYLSVTSEAELQHAVSSAKWPAVLKTARFGYDGKGQVKVHSASELKGAWESLGRVACVLEEHVLIDAEFSVIGCRDQRETFDSYGPLLNLHYKHILDLTVTHAAFPKSLSHQAIEITRSVMTQLNVIGTLRIEFFVSRGELYVNEMAPRPHNSGHFTIEACGASQFENHVRAVAGWPLGSTALRKPAAMVNLLGDVWQPGEPNWSACLEMPEVHLHLYGKAEAKPGRKMGHLTTLGSSPLAAARLALEARRALIAGDAETVVSTSIPKELQELLAG